MNIQNPPCNFSIDNVHNLHNLAVFLRHIDTVEVTGKTKGTMALAIGSWGNALETSFIMLKEDFDQHVKPHGFVDNQEAFLHVAPGISRKCSMVFHDGSIDHDVGNMVEVSKGDAITFDGFTYRPDVDQYWVIK